ncbi:hypothetical protein EDC30_11010 [Paucimonas lemoignei]|uniref:Excinuclease ATPase subunit n=1 Tax=Paucimonas lemoignei TaxID=29443 RepID=A0A4R3HRE8_PAULE|nr:hypothetical protein [Paucimonas lemoignei]TCS35542.1 hypothetical protein EDC30_11010 [Paucimonas lemoignei]
MKKAITMAWLGISMAAALAPAQARNDKLMVPISDALKVPRAVDAAAIPVSAAIQIKSPGVRYKPDDSVKFYFGPQAYPESAQKLGMRQSVGKEPIENNDDVASCFASFNEALVKLQKHARKFGANAIVNITSANAKNGQQVSSATDFECHAGSFSTAVTLRGELARISEQ